MRRWRGDLTALAAAAGLALGHAGAARAAAFTVTACGDSGQPGELRQVVQAAVDGDLIVLPVCTIPLASTLNLFKVVSLQGAGRGRTVLDGGATVAVLRVSIPSSELVRIADLSIVNGDAGAGGSGAGLFVNAGSVHLDGVEVSGHRAEGGNGAGIFHGGAVLTVTRSRISGNQASPGGSGAGLYINGGAVTLTETVVADNHADGPGARGGGIFHGGATLTVSGSLIAANSAEGANGGGIYDNGNRLFVTSSTIDRNRAARGAAIWLGGTTGALLHATVSGNAATVSGGAFDGTGAGLVLQSTLLGYNSGPAGPTCTAAGTVTSGGHNLVDDGSCGFGGPGDREVGDPLLADLADNGGPTETRALAEGSPALDAADPVGCPGTDQRGTLRPQGPACDVGAFEAVPTPPPPPPPPVNPLSVSPPTGAYLSTQALDFTIVVDAPGRTVVDGLVLVDGLDYTGAVVDCVRAGTLPTGGQTFHCPGVPAGVLGVGSHTVTVTLVLDDGTSLSRAVVWEILPAIDL